MKIVSLQSIGWGDSTTVLAVPGEFDSYVEIAPLFIEVGRDYQYSVLGCKVVSIHIGWDESERLNQSGTGVGNPEYLVKTSDGRIRVFPAKQYIAEWTDEDE